MTNFECFLVAALGALWIAAAAGLLTLGRRVERLERMTFPPDPPSSPARLRAGSTGGEVGVDRPDHH